MNGGRSDASTSTDDVKNRPLCLFYFTHPFGVLSPEPPTIAAAPPHIARAFVNMEPVSPFTFWGSPTDESYDTATTESRPGYELGAATVHRSPVSVVSVTRARKCTLDFSRGDSLSSSLFSSDVWFNSNSSGGRSTDYPRRLIPYNRILPPLRLPSPRDTSHLISPDDMWPKKCLNPEKFSLPPIEMPAVEVKVVQSKKMFLECGGEGAGASSGESLLPSRQRRRRRRLGVYKTRRAAARLGDVRRVLATLMHRALQGCAERGVSPAPALRDALHTIREAWAEPRSLLARFRAVNRTYLECEQVEPRPRHPAPHTSHVTMPERAQLAELSSRPGASPGLMRRRYSVPETIMRKYRLAQQSSDPEGSPPATDQSPTFTSPPRDACCSPCDTSHRFARRDRELMRKSALLRRMWGRPCEPCRGCCRCGEPPPHSVQQGRETRSLDGSRSELRHLSSGQNSPRHSPHAVGWATPKRQRLDLASDFRGSDEMLRAAMKNSYDRAEESRNDRVARTDTADCCTYRSHQGENFSYMETATDGFTDSECSKLNALVEYSDERSSDTTTFEIKSATEEVTPAASDSFAPQTQADEPILTDTSDTYSASFPTTKETNGAARLDFDNHISRSAHIDGRISERSVSVDNDDTNLMPYDKQIVIDTPSYEMLEIVVSETHNTSALPDIATLSPDRKPAQQTLKAPSMNRRSLQNINIDDYVSNILVESLNSLTDQLECMNASIGSDRKISIVEKEIKVKLQNTGVNTIVHLSPTSNNQIIFGNEELYNSECPSLDACNNTLAPRESITIREELVHSVESNNNLTSAGTTADAADADGTSQRDSCCPCDTFNVQHNNVNKAVLQQIQKLFREELHNFDSDIGYSNKVMPEISHIEISNVDVFIDNNTDPSMVPVDTVQVHASRATDDCEVISGVGPGNYYSAEDDNPVVPRFSAFPHTDSMEVNTSSSDDAEPVGSDCTSLVDSLDDPNSPRSVLLRRSFNNRRSELVRSAIDVLDLLPENALPEVDVQTKDKGESFFIRIKDNECDCDKENVNVADHMPEKIKQRLYRRHRNRELRMECARRSRVKQMKREAQRQRHDEAYRSRKEVERDCVAIVNALIDDVIAKIAQEEYKCMRIKHRPSKMVTSKSEENVAKLHWKKDLEPIKTSEAHKLSKNSAVGSVEPPEAQKQRQRSRGDGHQIHGKLSLLTRPTLTSDERGPKRIYQKSEIHEGNKCIEILEILEYVNGSQSSPETATSDENQNHSAKNKKSRIPVPVQEKTQRYPTDISQKNRGNKNSPPPRKRNGNTNRLIADMLLQVLADGDRGDTSSLPQPSEPPHRAYMSLAEPRSRSNSLRFKGTFDIIPEERSSLSLESGNEDTNQNRRASAPGIVDVCQEVFYDESSSPQAGRGAAMTPGRNRRDESAVKKQNTKSAGTSPVADGDAEKRTLRCKNQTTMTSPSNKSAATSPLRDSAGEANAGIKRGLGSRSRAWLGFARPDVRAPLEEVKGSSSRPTEAAKMRERRSLNMQSRSAAEVGPPVPPAQPERAETLAPGTGRAERRPRFPDRPDRDARTRRRAARPTLCPSHTDADLCHTGSLHDGIFENRVKRKSRTISLERSDEDTVTSNKRPEFKGGGDVSSSDSGESGGSLLCSLAPKWLSQARHRRAARRRDSAPVSPPPMPLPPPARPEHSIPGPGNDPGAGGWSVTVAGSCRATLPADVEMRLRFPHERINEGDAKCQECTCSHCTACTCSARAECVPHAARAPPLTAAPATRQHVSHHTHTRLARTDSSKLTLTMKKEALDSTILASKSSKKSGDPLPDLETYRASRSKLRSSVKTRRGYSLHCWLPENEPAPIRESNGLSVLGCAIVPELKPRVPTMSERDLTRIYTPRHYLRS